LDPGLFDPYNLFCVSSLLPTLSIVDLFYQFLHFRQIP
jgi:hypothetical protein